MATYTNILLAVVGESPAVVTETLWAARHRRVDVEGSPDPFIPERIIIVTTKRGKRIIEDGLHEGHELLRHPLTGRGQRDSNAGLNKYRRAYGDVPVPEIRLPELRDGTPIADISNEAESIAVADDLVRIVAELTRDETTCIHASIAGGRKTMSFFLGYIMSLFGRPQDKLSHVLVNDPDFERYHDFWFPMSEEQFPNPRDRWVGSPRDGKDAAKADVALCILPFIRLRYYFDAKQMESFASTSFDVVIKNVRAAIEPQPIVFDRARRQVHIGDGILVASFAHQNYAMLELLAYVAKHGNPATAAIEGAQRRHILSTDFYLMDDKDDDLEVAKETEITRKYIEILTAVHGAQDGDLSASRNLELFLATLARAKEKVAKINQEIKEIKEKGGNVLRLRTRKREIFNKFWNGKVARAKEEWNDMIFLPNPFLSRNIKLSTVKATKTRPAKYFIECQPELIRIIDECD